MTNYEIWSLIISLITITITISGLLYAGNQIKLARKQLNSALETIELTREIHKDNHDWNRRIASQNVINSFRNQNKTKELRESLDQIDINDAIPLDTIISKFKTDMDLQGYIHSVLNTFEGFSRGVNQGIYDEEVIKTALMGTMTRYFNCFRPYIVHIRKVRNPELYSEYESLINIWKTKMSEPKTRTRIGNT
ncbi:hypothetical protein GCM10011344_39560 [Dokdonia pacifica]|uniref:DUF4760 domain-containing protein n=1 Tax=Dokdonia pacifica TaxID=1627892 RepID=A0A239A507_9FLAO|nr:DUF4760 domain-containing protein [Dokdonia pacifica]GGG34868.1 hypothetical protein GCM10011344_39560 [Dokdonia pacifica]SNR90381.1 protein of unknown function [Dokdonia pacifica]